MKLLVIDSDRDLVEMLTSWLKTLGYDVLAGAIKAGSRLAIWLSTRI